jgi:hypothetical protein
VFTASKNCGSPVVDLTDARFDAHMSARRYAVLQTSSHTNAEICAAIKEKIGSKCPSRLLHLGHARLQATPVQKAGFGIGEYAQSPSSHLGARSYKEHQAAPSRDRTVDVVEWEIHIPRKDIQCGIDRKMLAQIPRRPRP